MTTLWCEDCLATMRRMADRSVGTVLTSPPYNTNTKAGKATTLGTMRTSGYAHVRYDAYVDTKTNAEYCDWTVGLFDAFDRILRKDGLVVYNLSYGAENTECMSLAVAAILSRTAFTLADVVYWRKSNALPNNVSPLHLTRIVEPFWVFVRRADAATACANKAVKSVRKNGQRMFENVLNAVAAKNNDGPCPFNKATFSSEVCEKLLRLYHPVGGGAVYDPFVGSGTTAVACARLGADCIGSEISEKQVEFARDRIVAAGAECRIGSSARDVESMFG